MRDRMAARRAANAETKAQAAQDADKAALEAVSTDAKQAEEALKKLAADTPESVGGGQGNTSAPDSAPAPAPAVADSIAPSLPAKEAPSALEAAAPTPAAEEVKAPVAV
eukprot:TRINITY_DN14_c0_g1_i6.p3 TRINITY_DN14_c0_g1~~TRINITY_DN14_c0_g1_i6.p3  ORF type:complete len:109 (+),score=46.18 TRINITY_DN14_c0_g1_i6:216-542(+)